MTRHWLNHERLTNYPRILMAFYLLSVVLTVATSHGGLDFFKKPLGHDFITYWAASRLALEGNAAGAYDVLTIVRTEWAVVPGIHTLNPWVYPPTFFLVVLPLALLPYFISYFVFMALTFAGYFGVVRRIFRGAGSLPLLLAFPGVYVNFMEGQNAFLTASLIGGALLLLEKRPIAAGILVGLLTIKPHLGLLLPLALVCGRHWRALFAASLTSALFLALSVEVLGTDTLTAFVAALRNFPALIMQDWKLAAKVPSAFAAAKLLGVPQEAAYVVQAAVAIPAAAAVAWVWWHCRELALRSSVLVVASLLVSPYVLNYDLAWLGLPIAWMASLGLREGWQPWEREVLAAAWLLPLVVVPLAIGTHLQIGPVVLAAMLILLLRRARQHRRAPSGSSLAAEAN